MNEFRNPTLQVTKRENKILSERSKFMNFGAYILK
jgi:hypothetical protein